MFVVKKSNPYNISISFQFTYITTFKGGNDKRREQEISTEIGIVAFDFING